MIRGMPDGECRESQASALAAVGSASRLESVGRRHRSYYAVGIGERIAQVCQELGLGLGRTWPASAAALRRLLLLNFVEHRKVVARDMLDLLGERPDVLELAVRRPKRIVLGWHGVRQSDEGLLDLCE